MQTATVLYHHFNSALPSYLSASLTRIRHHAPSDHLFCTTTSTVHSFLNYLSASLTHIKYHAPSDHLFRTIISTVHSCLTFQLRAYISYQTSCMLRSSSEKLLKIPNHNLKSFGESFCSISAPSVWNLLPAGLQNLPTMSEFETQLKTFLFRQASS